MKARITQYRNLNLCNTGRHIFCKVSSMAKYFSVSDTTYGKRRLTGISTGRGKCMHEFGACVCMNFVVNRNYHIIARWQFLHVK